MQAPDYADMLLPPVRQASLDLQTLQMRSPGQELSNDSQQFRHARDFGSTLVGDGFLNVCLDIHLKYGVRHQSTAQSCPLSRHFRPVYIQYPTVPVPSLTAAFVKASWMPAADERGRVHGRQASEKAQGRKPRAGEAGWCGWLWGKWRLRRLLG